MNVLVFLLLALAACRAEVIDRVAVVVGKGVITESEIMREIRLTAFLKGAPLDFSAGARRTTAERLVEQHLIRAEIQVSPYPAPAQDAVERALKEVRDNFPSVDRYRQELRRAGITEDELKAHLQRQISTLRFIDFRFRPGIQVSEDEIGAYFDQRIAPELRKAHPGMEFSLADYRSQIEDALIGERVDKASDTWLKEARDHTRIEFRAGAFAPDPPPQEASK